MTIVEHIIINLAFVIIFNMSIIECALPECYHHKSQQNSFRGTLSSFALNKYKIISQKGKCAKSKFSECNSTSRSRNMNHHTKEKRVVLQMENTETLFPELKHTIYQRFIGSNKKIEKEMKIERCIFHNSLLKSTIESCRNFKRNNNASKVNINNKIKIVKISKLILMST